MQRGCEAYITFVTTSMGGKAKLFEILVVCEFPDVFLDDLPSLLPQWEIDFAVDLVPVTQPISKAPYRMAPNELKGIEDVIIGANW